MKKFFTGVISVLTSAMLVLPAYTAFAAEGDPDPDPGTSSPTSVEFSSDSTADLELKNAKKGDKFNAYKIIDITYDQASNTLIYDWNPDFRAYITGLDNDPNTTLTVEQYRSKSADERRAILAGLHSYILEHSDTISPVTEAPVSAVADSEDSDVATVIFNGLGMGGYLIAAVETTDVYQLAFKAIEPEIEDDKYVLKKTVFSVGAKHTPMTITKTADHTSARTNETITYSIIADVPSYGTNAIEKAFDIKDVLPDSIDIDVDSIKVYSHTAEDPAVDANDWTKMTADATYTLTFGTQTGDHIADFTIKIENIENGTQQFNEWYSYSVTEKPDGTFETTYTAKKTKIKIEYTAILNEKAKMASKNLNEGSTTEYTVGKNTNIATLTFYPYPYVIGKDNKPDTYSVDADYSVYTYGLEIMKIGNNDDTKLLSGAKFKLYSDATKDEGGNITGVVETSLLTGYYYRTSSSQAWTLADENTEIETANGYVFVKGLDAGKEYYLKEVAAPSGYNLPENPVVAISTALAENSHLLNAVDSSISTIKGAANLGYAFIKVDNLSGFTLPSTGGTGVLILKILGVIGMAAAVIVVTFVLISPKKKASK